MTIESLTPEQRAKLHANPAFKAMQDELRATLAFDDAREEAKGAAREYAIVLETFEARRAEIEAKSQERLADIDEKRALIEAQTREKIAALRTPLDAAEQRVRAAEAAFVEAEADVKRTAPSC